MDYSTSLQKTGYRASIPLQPQSLEVSRQAVDAALEGIDLARFRHGTIGLVGIGASLQAALTAASGMRERGLRAFGLCATDLFDPAVMAADAYVAISASGRSRETVHAMELRKDEATIGLSKIPDSPLSAVVGDTIAMATGIDGGPNTTSYTGSLQALGMLADRIAGVSRVDWSALPDLAAALIEQVARPIRQAGQALAGRRAFDFVGAGAAQGNAGEAALLLREAARIPAWAFDTLNYLHGPMESQDHDTALVVFGDGRELKLAQDVAALGCPTVLITGSDAVGDAKCLSVVRVPKLSDGIADAILQILPAQLLVAELSDMAGLTNTAFRYRQTDTKFPSLGG